MPTTPFTRAAELIRSADGLIVAAGAATTAVSTRPETAVSFQLAEA